jgi:monoamine oxidase
MAKELGECIVLNAPASAMEQSSAGVTAHTALGPFAGKHAIVAVPPALAGRIKYDPSLPARRDQLTSRMPLGSVIKYVAVYSRPFWREAGLSGEAFSDTGPTVTTFDDCSADGAQAALVSFSDGEAARIWTERTPEERREAVLSEFVRFFGAEAGTPITFVEKNWLEEEWSRGCYVGVTSPGTLTSFGTALREPCGRIHWAGTETAVDWMGYMEGALQSAERAAQEVNSALRASRL